MERTDSTYTCPLCGKEHQNNDLCPIVLTKRKKIKYNSQSFLMSGIILECFERDASFWRILQEIVYYIEKVSYSEYGYSQYFNADFIISYFAASLGCTPSKFYKKLPELSEKYSKVLEQADGLVNTIYVKADDDNNIDQVSMLLEEGSGPLWNMLTGARSDFSEPLLYLDKVFCGKKPSYYLRLDFSWMSDRWRNLRHIPKDNNNPKKKNHEPEPVFVHYGNLSFAENSVDLGFNLYAEKEGALKEYFESTFDDYFDWTDIAEQNPCTYSIACDWVSRLEDATNKGFLVWDLADQNEKTIYFTTYGESRIKITLMNETHALLSNKHGLTLLISKTISDEICILENERRIFHYGGSNDDELIEAYDGFTQEIIQEPMLRRLCKTINTCINKWDRGDFLTKIVKKTINNSDVLSVTYSFICSQKGHIVIPYCGIITVLTPDGGEIEEKVYLGYCRNCGVYYIFKRDYDNICKKGEPQCKVVDAATNKTIWDASFNINNRSILFEMGYNVQASNNLSAEERQQILKRAIEEKRISVNEILNLLEMQIALHSGRGSYINAIEKWKEDSDFVKEYGIDSGRIKKISEIHG